MSMSREELIEHLRTAHGFGAYEEGGEGYLSDAPWKLDSWIEGTLEALHLEDHSEYPAGDGGPVPHTH